MSLYNCGGISIFFFLNKTDKSYMKPTMLH